MNERVLLTGRPRGGAAIIWKRSLKSRVTPIYIESQRVCAASIIYDISKVLLICVNMSCNDNINIPNQNIIEYKSVLKDIITLCNGADAHYVIVGGDFNRDLSRISYFTRHFMEYGICKK